MKIKFNRPVELQIIECFDAKADEVTGAYFEKFDKGGIHDVDLMDFVSPYGDGKVETCTIQFGDGSCCYNVQRSWFDIMSTTPA